MISGLEQKEFGTRSIVHLRILKVVKYPISDINCKHSCVTLSITRNGLVETENIEELL